ncbi:acyl-CoA thioesterase [Neptunicella marina]|uniref:Acyl-CoA thioesterase 2 n=1 Tax=Neptunicella marina TaxID=2125989 RepID=A0A8J6IYB5_9ALTE|nr:acyl-CoA thioesterase II [Neptunicella marina]MBC3767487.1 acyl-CoA thioesterase II [Neptunicella marina]
MKEVKLSELLTLEQLETELYRGQSWDLGFRALFGGQVLGQALAAAQQTVAEGQVAHSLHSYFLLPGDASKAVVYDVESIRDGRSFCTRRVKAIQNGRTIFFMTVSFQFPETGLEHQFAQMPDVPAAETLTPEIECYRKLFANMPDSVKEKLSYHEPIDMRSVQSINPAAPESREPVRYVWMRANEALGADISMHQRMMAYASDYYFLVTALQPHGLSIMDKSIRMATIDHAIWFHREFDFNQWVLYCMDSPFAGNARGLVKGQFFDLDGNLIASTMQEGLVRHIQS